MRENESIQPMFSDKLRQKNNAVNIEGLISKVTSYWPLFLFSIIITLSIGYIYLRYKTPVYNVTAKIMINDQRKGVSDMDLLNDLGVRQRPANVENEMEVLKSRALMEKVVAALDLHIRYIVKGAVKSSDLYVTSPVKLVPLFDDAAIEQAFVYTVAIDKNRVSITDNKKTIDTHIGDTVMLSAGKFALVGNERAENIKELTISISPIAGLANGYSNALMINNPNRLMSILALSISDIVPKRGEDILNKLVEVYIQSSIDDRNRVADGTMDFINDRLVLVSSELTDIEKDIEGFKKTNELTDVKAQASMLLAGTGDYAKQVNTQEIQLSLVESLEKYIRDNSNNDRLVPASLVQDQVFSGIVLKYNELLADKEKLLMTNTESSPYIVNIEKQLANLRGDMLNSLVSIKRQLQVSLVELRKMEGKLNAEIQQVPAKERVYLEFSRQQTIKQELYLFLLKKREETAISKTATTSDAKIIDVAQSGGRPVSPNRKVVFLSAIVFGLLLPGAWIFIKDLLNVRISSKEDVENNTKMAVLAEIGHSDEEDAIPVKTDSRGLIAEQFRALRTNLQFLLTREQENIIMITSSMSGEGKSFAAINLAGIMAISGKKVLLMELDLRKPKISSNLGIDNHIGFSSYAIGQASLNEVIKPSGVFENFYVMPSGPIPPNPAELVMLPRITELFDKLRSEFDYVIVDTAPIGLVTDAQLLSKYADAVLYIVRHNYTFKRQVASADELYQSGKMPRMNVVINDVKLQSNKYGYGYGYGYYGNGYFTQQEEGSRLVRAVNKVRRRISKRFSK